MWCVEYEPSQQRLTLHLADQVTLRDLEAIAEALARAVSFAADTTFAALFDLRGLAPLEGDAVNQLGDLKRQIVDNPQCSRFAVLTDGATVDMQQARTDVGGASIRSLDPAEVLSYLKETSGP